MIGWLKRVFRGRRLRAISYEKAKRLSRSSDPARRCRVARDDRVRPELLYFLASDPEPAVRAAVAGNSATPRQADLLLARDGDERVRRALAGKIARLVPRLDARTSERLSRALRELLDILAADEAARVRQIIAEALQARADAPHEIVGRLARDGDIAVAGPVLQHSPVLSEGELIDIVDVAPASGACEAVARRQRVGEDLADAIDRTGDILAITALLENRNAQIREATLDSLIDRAPKIVPWHRPLVSRPHLSASAARKLAVFVAANLLEILRARTDLDPAAARDIAGIMMRRLGESGGLAAASASPLPTALDRASEMLAAGTLHDEALLSALRQGDHAFVKAALALLASMPIASVERVLAAQSAKGVVALAWRAGLAMRTAIRLQVALGRIAQSAVIEPRADGGYPLPEEAMRWQLDFLTGGVAR
ncbi:MAG TPA: DUF2336 domain-containing protein [Stellaceae bacterium]|nr:DUF2336 domain-containing protein [Stellaceae bacterium]